jgi:hypothetical protein
MLIFFIYIHLSLFMKFQMPTTPAHWLAIAKQFHDKWNFPHCLGAIDGKHVVIQAPMNSGSEFFNYKSNFSIVLFAVVDADYNFTFIDVGCQGRISDGGVFKHTSFHLKLNNNNLGLPEDCPLLGRSEPMPYVFVGDEAFPLTKRIMKPFPGIHDKGTLQRNFNFRLSRARRIVENVFGISSSVFRVLRKPMLLEPEKVTIVTTCVAYLHNFLRRNSNSRNIYTPPGTFDQEDNHGNIVPGTWRQEEASRTSFLSLRAVPRKSAEVIQEIRNEFASYFENDWT